MITLTNSKKAYKTSQESFAAYRNPPIIFKKPPVILKLFVTKTVYDLFLKIDQGQRRKAG